MNSLKVIAKRITSIIDIGIPLRIAITGSTSSPSIVHIMEILGKQKTLDRLNINVDTIKNWLIIIINYNKKKN